MQNRNFDPGGLVAEKQLRAPRFVRRAAISAVRHVEVMFCGIAGDPDQPLDLIVIRTQVVIVDRPIFSEGLRRPSLEVHVTVPEACAAPGIRTAASTPQSRPMEFFERVIPVLSRVGVQMRGVLINLPEPIVFTGFATSAERQLPRPGVRHEVLGGIQHPSRFQHAYAQALGGKDICRCCAARAGAHDYNVKRLHWHLSTFRLNWRIRGSPSVEAIRPQPVTELLVDQDVQTIVLLV